MWCKVLLRQRVVMESCPVTRSRARFSVAGVCVCERVCVCVRMVVAALLFLNLAKEAAAEPFSCQSGLFNKSTPLQKDKSEYKVIFGTMGMASAGVTLFSPEFSGGRGIYDVVLLSNLTVAITRYSPDRSDGTTKAIPPDTLSSSRIRYFWVKVLPTQDELTVSIGRVGETAALETYVDSSFPTDPTGERDMLPLEAKFVDTPVVHSCNSNPITPTLGCRKRWVTSHYNFSTFFPISEEAITLDNNAKAIRFMVMSSREAFVRLKGSTPGVHYEFDLNFVNRYAVQRNAVYLATASCRTCTSGHEYRLFTVVIDKNTLKLFEGTSESAVLSVNLNIDLTHIGFASLSSVGRVYWLHACQGDSMALPSADSSTQPPPLLPKPLSKDLRDAALNSTDLAGCRQVHTFKYSFDGFFALSEEGAVVGSVSVLPIRILGRKDVHIQLTSEVPPPRDAFYEIDIDFHNHTNVERGQSSLRVASVQIGGLLNVTKLKAFIITHDASTGLLIISTIDDNSATVPIVRWVDPRPFPLRYFSVCSGSSAGNDTTWVFGCPNYPPNLVEEDRVKSGCSRPLVTHKYSHSQYLSVEREGMVNGSVRLIRVFLRAKGSGHIRLEHSLPPAFEHLLEVDLFHDGSTSIDYQGRQVATVSTPDLLTETELRGFWLRQDMDKRTVEVGKDGENMPLVHWTATATSKFPEFRFFSLTTSRSVGNGTWYYGCHASSVPNTNLEHDAMPETIPEEAFVDQPAVEPPPSFWPSSGGMVNGSSKALSLKFGEFSQPPPDNTSFGVSLTINKLDLDDTNGLVEVRGHLFVTWNSTSIKWDPHEYDDIMDINNVDLGLTWTPDFSVYNGDVDLGGVVHLQHTGVIRWEASLHAEARCVLDGRHWPHDEHRCTISMALVDQGRRLHLIIEHPDVGTGKQKHKKNAAVKFRPWVAPSAADPLWKLELATVNATAPGTLHITVTMRRSLAVLSHVLLAPFIVLSALLLAAYWVREPLPRDKMLLGCGSLLLLVLSFLVVETMCPPGLVGMPIIVEVYCYCLVFVVVSVITSATLTAMARDRPTRCPPRLLCSILSMHFVRKLLFLSLDQVHQSVVEDQLSAGAENYKKGSNQVYTRFDHGSAPNCGCTGRICGKQAAIEAQYYWTLLTLACERILSFICFSLLIVAVVLVK